jgi:hypothetical protein
MFFAGCSSTLPPPHGDTVIGGGAARYSLVFIIHGDGDYLYHNTRGEARRADEDVLARAQVIARALPDAEVTIFHEIARRHVMFVVPRHDGRAFYYRQGQLVGETSYWRDQGDSRFAPEASIYQKFGGAQSGAAVRMFFYFGHELPELNIEGYDASYPERRVAVGDLARSLGAFAGPSGKLDLVVLGTCFGGTPHSLDALAPYAHTIIASPGDLHLSYFDLEPLATLDIGPAGDRDVAAFADRFARHAFERLTADVQTAVSIVVYDVAATRAFRASVAGAYETTLARANGMPASVRRCDCADDASYARAGMSNGLTVLYRAPRFGRTKNEQHHSGWECWRIGDEPRAPNPENAGARP